MQLRGYQSDAIADVREAMRQHRRVLLVSPTASGKTQMFSYVAAGVCKKERRVLVLAHRKELIRQIGDALTSWDVPHSRIAPGSTHIPTANVLIGNVFTVVKRIAKIKPPDLIIVDECHHATTGGTWGKILEAFPNARVLGVTATPCRLDGRGLAENFDVMVMGPSVAELTEWRFLSPAEVYAPSKPNLASVKKRMGDYVTADLAKEMNQPTITGNAVQTYLRICPQASAMAFCVSIAHAKTVAEEFRSFGIAAESVDGEMAEVDRDRVLDGLRNGRVKVVTSCDLISEGFDVPAVECVILLRPTKSLALYLQQVGRGLRIAPGKTKTIVLDHAANTMAHGFIDEPQDWTLAGGAAARKSGAAPVRTCPQCVAPETRILYSDMIWRPIGRAMVGDKILAFDEHNCGVNGFTRRLRETEIKNIWRQKKDSVKITAAGRSIICSPDHQWLVRRSNDKWPQDNWRRADDIGMKEKLLEVIPPREHYEDEDFKRGYICGMTDGDGTFRFDLTNKGKPWRQIQPHYWRVAIQENDHKILSRLKDYFNPLGVYLEIKPYWRAPSTPSHHSKMIKVEARSWAEMEIIDGVLSDIRPTDSFKRGYISGFFDAEGSHSGTVRMTQKNPEILNLIKSYGESLGMSFLLEGPCNKWAYKLRLQSRPRENKVRRRNGIVEKLNFFTQIIPALERKLKNDGAPFNPERIDIESILPYGECELVDIETGTGTFIAEGFATHNCFAAHRPAPTCPMCGFSYVPNDRADSLKYVKGELVLVVDPKSISKVDLLGPDDAPNVKRKKELDYMTMLARKRGYKNPEGWAYVVCRAKEAKRRTKVLQKEAANA